MDDLLLLSSICGDLGLSERIAQRKASLGLLPFPAFRLSGTRKGPLYVRKEDFDAHVKRQVEKAMKLNSTMREAGLV
ncbi:hypothetical protein [Rhodoferax sp. GW822-FHT02A01]|uniref:pyocin activator PrtN family protein n=1 Tax=Rhodoferax sp. GW822-FHT02A01 TaxID=3141537 RepID=UPI00315CFB71